MVSAFSETSANTNSSMLAWDTSGDDIDVGQAGICQQFTGLCRGSAFNDYAFQIVARFKCTIPNARYTIRNRHTCQSSAIPERPIPDARHTVGDRHTCKAIATMERIISDTFYVGMYRHVCKISTFFEHPRYNARNIIWDRHTCHTTAGERTIPNA